MAGNQDGLIHSIAQLPDKIPHFRDADGVKAIDRLVEDQKRGVFHNRLGDAQPLAHAEAVLLIQAGAGSEFDPRLVEAFVAVADAFAEVARRYADSAEALDVEMQRLEQAVAESIELTAPPA